MEKCPLLFVSLIFPRSWSSGKIQHDYLSPVFRISTEQCHFFCSSLASFTSTFPLLLFLHHHHPHTFLNPPPLPPFLSKGAFQMRVSDTNKLSDAILRCHCSYCKWYYCVRLLCEAQDKAGGWIALLLKENSDLRGITQRQQQRQRARVITIMNKCVSLEEDCHDKDVLIRLDVACFNTPPIWMGVGGCAHVWVFVRAPTLAWLMCNLTIISVFLPVCSSSFPHHFSPFIFPFSYLLPIFSSSSALV